MRNYCTIHASIIFLYITNTYGQYVQNKKGLRSIMVPFEKNQHTFWAKKTGAIQDGAGMSDLTSEGESEKTAIECGGNDFFS